MLILFSLAAVRRELKGATSPRFLIQAEVHYGVDFGTLAPLPRETMLSHLEELSTVRRLGL